MHKVIFLSIRFLFSRKINLLLILLIAICLGCLITVSSVAHGFSIITAEQTKSVYSDITVEIPNHVLGISDYEEFTKSCMKIEGVASVAPFVKGQALYSDEYGQDSACTVFGIKSEMEKDVSLLLEKFDGDLKAPECFERRNQRGVVLGSSMPRLPNNSIITLFAKEGSLALETRGFYKTGIAEWDFTRVLVSMETAQILFGARDFEPEKYRKMATGMRIKIKEGYEILDIQKAIRQVFYELAGKENEYGILRVYDFRDMNAIEIKAMESYEKIIHIILMIMLIMITFSIFIPVHSMVHEKTKDIGILKALGASKLYIFCIFVFVGVMLGVASTIIGLPLGFLISSSLNEILDFFNYNPFPPDVFYVDKLPIIYHKEGIMMIVFFINFVAIVASILPAYRASCLKPIDLIRR